MQVKTDIEHVQTTTGHLMRLDASVHIEMESFDGLVNIGNKRHQKALREIINQSLKRTMKGMKRPKAIVIK